MFAYLHPHKYSVNVCHLILVISVWEPAGICKVTNLCFSEISTLPRLFVRACVCLCAGSHRVIDAEFDDGLMVVNEGGWGAW